VHERLVEPWRSAVASCVALIIVAGAGATGAPIPASKPASYPSWWFVRGVIPLTNPANQSPTWPNDYPPGDDYSAINLGQLKQMAAAAYDEFQSLPGGSGADLDKAIKSWFQLDSSGNFVMQNGSRVPLVTSSTDDFAVATIGQVKSIAQIFYERLTAVGDSSGGGYPWSTSTVLPDDFTIANLGQLKSLLSFDPNYSTIGDGIPDWWKEEYGLSIYDPSVASADYDGEGISNLQKYQQGIDPFVPPVFQTLATPSPAPTPANFNIPPGSYSIGQSVTIFTNTSTAEIVYTTDGSSPLTNPNPAVSIGTSVVVPISVNGTVLNAASRRHTTSSTTSPFIYSPVTSGIYYLLGSIAAGINSGFSVNFEGTASAWGENNLGQLGAPAASAPVLGAIGIPNFSKKGAATPRQIASAGFYSITATGRTTNGTKSVTLAAAISPDVVGWAIGGAGIPANTTVTAQSGTALTISTNATASASTTLSLSMRAFPSITATGMPAHGTKTVTLTAALSQSVVGWVVSGAGIPANTTVTDRRNGKRVNHAHLLDGLLIQYDTRVVFRRQLGILRQHWGRSSRCAARHQINGAAERFRDGKPRHSSDWTHRRNNRQRLAKLWLYF
jgi:hypothetical protein